MKRDRQVRGLVALNAALLGVLGVVTFAPAAQGQRGSDEPVRARGEYTMVAGEIQGTSEAAVYIIDAANQEFVAVLWDNARKELQPIGFRDMASDARRALGGSR